MTTIHPWFIRADRHADGNAEVLTILSKCFSEFLVCFWIKSKLFGQCVTKILHLGEIAALVVFEKFFENLDSEKCLLLECELSF